MSAQLISTLRADKDDWLLPFWLDYHRDVFDGCMLLDEDAAVANMIRKFCPAWSILFSSSAPMPEDESVTVREYTPQDFVIFDSLSSSRVLLQDVVWHAQLEKPDYYPKTTADLLSNIRNVFSYSADLNDSAGSAILSFRPVEDIGMVDSGSEESLRIMGWIGERIIALKNTDYIYYVEPYANCDWGEDRVLLADDINLLENTDFNDVGYKVFSLASNHPDFSIVDSIEPPQKSWWESFVDKCRGLFCRRPADLEEVLDKFVKSEDILVSGLASYTGVWKEFVEKRIFDVVQSRLFFETASLRQSGLEETASLGQSGLEETASLGQSGLEETASLGQSGLEETASLGQSRLEEEPASLGQSGLEEEPASLGQSGLEETASLRQSRIYAEDYHKYVTEEEHTRIINAMPYKKTDSPELLEFAEHMESRVSQILGQKVKIFNDDLWVRICRPDRVSTNDYNPCHRDVYLDFYRNIVNIYVPIVGSNELSSLMMEPGSHLWNERDTMVTKGGAEFKNAGKKYSVDAIVQSRQRLNMACPNPEPDEFILFSPYLIHGCSSNANTDVTRMSVEVRFIQDTDAGRAQEAAFNEFLKSRVWR